MVKGKKNRVKVRHRRILKRLSATGNSRVRLLVRKSLKHIYAILIDDRQGKIITSLTGKSKNIASARELGKQVAETALKAGLAEVVFDRGGYLYHGRVKALAESAREAGLKF